MRVKIQLLYVALSISFSVSAQDSKKQFRLMELKGFIADSTTARGIAGATVEIRFDNPSTSAIYPIDSLHRLVVSSGSGEFELGNIPLSSRIIITVYALGYKINSKRINITEEKINGAEPVIVELGTIRLSKDIKALGAVVVTAITRQLMELDAEKKIFNADKSTIAQGGTTVDLLKNIPSVAVDADGNVTLRNSSPQILVDGRPTLLTPEQIPADMVDKVELITNPSAKYDAASAGGIINIVLKKNKKAGINGLTSLGAGTPGLLNGNLSLNFRQNKINISGAVNYNRSGGTTKEQTVRENKNNEVVTDYFEQQTFNDRTRKFRSVRFGADYFFDKNNTFSFIQNFNGGNFTSSESQLQSYSDQDHAPTYNGIRNAGGTSDFRRSSSRLTYERKLPGEDHTLSADITFNTGNGKNNSAYTNNFYATDGNEYANPTRVLNDGADRNRQFTAQVDYMKKINDQKKIEAGLRSFYSSSSSYYNSFSLDPSDIASKLPLSNNFKFSESVNAGYINYTGKWKSISWQAGLRMEFSKFNGTMIDSNYSFGYRFPDGFKNLDYSFFPSFYLTKSLNDNNDLQLNYSKRIRRPGFWQVNPFVSISDPLNIRQGNAALQPEYTNSFELNYFNRFAGNKGSLLATLYLKNNVGDITQYSDTISQALLEQLNNAAVASAAILNTYINAGHTNRTGVEIILQKKLLKHLDFNYSLDFQYRKTKARVNDLVLDNEGFNAGTKLTANYKIITASKLFNNLSFQLTGNYQGPRIIPQGRIKHRFFSDFAVRKEFLKKKAASLSFAVNDLFNTRKFGTIYDTKQFYQDSYRRWSVRTFRITFSYRFGNTRPNLFRKKNNNEGEADNEFEGSVD